MADYREIANKYIDMVIQRYGEDRVKVTTLRRRRKGYAGRARMFADGTVQLEIPKRITLDGLYSVIHEVAHVLLGHLKQHPPVTTAEYEAEDYTLSAMRKEGIRIPDSLIRRGKIDVANHVIDAMMEIPRGYIDRRAVRFSWELLPKNAQEDLRAWGYA